MDTTIVTLVGAGRDLHTRALRRQHRFRRRVFRLGENIVVRSGRRVPVKVELLRPHLAAMEAHMARGALAVMLLNKRLTFAELTELVYPGAPMESAPAEDLPAEDLEPGTVDDPEALAAAIAEGTITEITEEEPADAAEATELADDTAPAAEPAVSDEPAPADAGERAARHLPEEWETRSNSQLIKLHTRMEITVPTDTRKQSLIRSLTEWVEG